MTRNIEIGRKIVTLFIIEVKNNKQSGSLNTTLGIIIIVPL